MGLKMIAGSSATGGGGGGVQSVTAEEPILVDNTDPLNPVVSFETIVDTKANILALLLGGTLKDGATYTISDMAKTFTDGSSVEEATFQAKIVDNLGVPILQQYGQGWGHNKADANIEYIIGYNIIADEIFYLEHQPLNQIAQRILGSTHNCIEEMQWGTAGWSNNFFDNSDLLNTDVNNTVQFVTMLPGSSIGFDSQTAIFIYQCTLGINSIIRELKNDCGVVNTEMKQGAIIDFNGHNNCSVNQSILHSNATINLTASAVTVKAIIGVGSTLNADIQVDGFVLGIRSTVTTNGFLIFDSTIGDDFTIILQDVLQTMEVQKGYSTAFTGLDPIPIFAAGVLTLPAGYDYFGEIILSDDAGGNITNIVGMPGPFTVLFRCFPGKSNIFQAVAVAGAANNDIVGTAADIAGHTIVGRLIGTDSIILRNNVSNQIVTVNVNA